ncbi:MAG: LLM class flavin-dependent oxidoreductase [Actinomycetota bacterium]
MPPSVGADVPNPNDLWKIAEAADASDLLYLWVSDHVVWWHPMYESLTLLAAIAARTKRIHVGPAVLLLAMRNPVLAAKSLATIHRLSGGRLAVGVGVGGEFPPEWDAVGVDLRTRARRTDEMIEALRGLWGPTPFSLKGEHISLDQVDLQPKMDRPPPIWIGGRSDAALARAARSGDAWMGIFLTPERYRERLSRMREAAASNGRDPKEITASLYAWTCIADTTAEAREKAGSMLGAFYNLPFSKLERFAIVGDAATCASRFEEFAEAGVENFAVAAITADASTDQLDRLTTSVLPKVRGDLS